MEYKIDAENIRCDGCASTIRDTLLRISGVHEVTVEIATGRITVKADEGLHGAIRAALQASGYPERNPGGTRL
jgi:copper chaperone CopZ